MEAVVLKCRKCGRVPWFGDPTMILVGDDGRHYRSHVDCVQSMARAQQATPSNHQEVKYQPSRRRQRAPNE